jgi:hypothetical protein
MKRNASKIRITGWARLSALWDRSRLEREQKTVDAMLALYCRAKHGGGNPLCPACAELRDYAAHRLKRCRFGPQKPVCASCPVHCYPPAFRIRMKDVMRFAGPRMLVRHPLLALLHLMDAGRKP